MHCRSCIRWKVTAVGIALAPTLAMMALLAGAGASCSPLVRAAEVYQWSVRCPSIPGRRAYLWIPPACRRVRGLIVACQNMLERPLFADRQFRATLARDSLGLVLIFPGHDKSYHQPAGKPPRKPSYLDIFLNPNYPHGHMNPQAAGADLQKVLNRLAAVSGYSEVKNVPVLPIGHSSAGNFVWYLYRWNPNRIIAMVSFKAGTRFDGPLGIPILEVNSEWFDYGHRSDNVGFGAGNLASRLAIRARGPQSLFGYYVDVGAGHCNVSAQSITVVAKFIEAVMKLRLPDHASPNGLERLNPIRGQNGWLLDGAAIGRPGTQPVAYDKWRGNPANAFWYPTRGVAEAVQNQMQSDLEKKPQQIGFIHDGKLFAHGGMFSLTPHFLPDGATFKVHAVYIAHLAGSNLFPRAFTLGHSDEPIRYAVTSGGIIQVGRRSFRICPHGGPLTPQGNPWQPTVIAYSLGGRHWQPTVHPVHININIFNHAGMPQSLSFPQPANVQVGQRQAIKLRATASSGLPVEYFVVSGPAVVEGNVLRFTAIPPRSRWPLKVMVGAFQWGRETTPPVQSVGPVLRTFLIRKP